ncbi:pyruvate oxidase [Paraburkholderia fungorum]|uniref:Pyruvate oxidase n=1 Tax=Paraburkholderia fungorum TaxID=134537 RepID=A0A1H1JPQ0_9BURK|nr:thiamine pyrophosphate-binding protein [Paraburkholderia fungorum]SDR51437.1 pyruvate oxidase [Paraburkholderia fungorum]
MPSILKPASPHDSLTTPVDHDMPPAAHNRDGAPSSERRRMMLKAAAAGGAGLFAVRTIAAQAPAASSGQPVSAAPQPPFSPGDNASTAEVVVQTLLAWNVDHVFGMVGDGINPLIEALRRHRDTIRFIGVRHEEAAAFMASGWAKATGRLGVCLATTGPGAVHLMNGLYDAHFDGAPVLAITGLTFHDLVGTRFQQGVDTPALMQDVALYNTTVTGPRHALVVTDIACRSALGARGVAHLAISKDIQAMRLADDKASMENHGLRTSTAWRQPASAPADAQLRAAADAINAGSRVAILAGQGALGASEELEQIATRLNAPVAKALLGRSVIPDDSPFSTGGIGHLGTVPSEEAMHRCDTVLILGSTMPWVDSYPKPGTARGVQVDIKAERIGLRYPVEVCLVGDTKETLRALLPLLHQKDDTFLREIQAQVTQWNALLDQVASSERTPIRPQRVIRAISDTLAADAIVCLDCGANTHFAARFLTLRREQQLVATGMLATMAPGLPFAIAAQLANPGRQVVAIVGDGGLAMLMAELSTAVMNRLPIKIIVMRNDMLAEVVFEQKELGNPPYGCELGGIDFAQVAAACGAVGTSCHNPQQLQVAIASTLASPGTVLLEVHVDPAEPITTPDKLKA